MGVPQLNRYLRTHCADSMSQQPLTALRGRCVAIDASIYMYRALSDDCLIEGMFQLLSVLRHCGITPVLVFDGKAPAEKNAVLDERRERRQRAVARRTEIETLLVECTDPSDREDLQAELNSAKKAAIHLRRSDVAAVRELCMSMGVAFVDADGEADVLCAQLVNKKHVYACLSEDMDMFVYGCKRVLRYLSLLSRTVVVYEFDQITNTLAMTPTQFRDVCVLAGTDYSKGARARTPVARAMELHVAYREAGAPGDDFFEWCEREGHLGPLGNAYALLATSLMFELDNYSLPRGIGRHTFRNGPIAIENMERVLGPIGFVFLPPPPG